MSSPGCCAAEKPEVVTSPMIKSRGCAIWCAFATPTSTICRPTAVRRPLCCNWFFPKSARSSKTLSERRCARSCSNIPPRPIWPGFTPARSRRSPEASRETPSTAPKPRRWSLPPKIPSMPEERSSPEARSSPRFSLRSPNSNRRSKSWMRRSQPPSMTPQRDDPIPIGSLRSLASVLKPPPCCSPRSGRSPAFTPPIIWSAISASSLCSKSREESRSRLPTLVNGVPSTSDAPSTWPRSRPSNIIANCEASTTESSARARPPSRPSLSSLENCSPSSTACFATKLNTTPVDFFSLQNEDPMNFPKTQFSTCEPYRMSLSCFILLHLAEVHPASGSGRTLHEMILRLEKQKGAPFHKPTSLWERTPLANPKNTALYPIRQKSKHHADGTLKEALRTGLFYQQIEKGHRLIWIDSRSG